MPSTETVIRAMHTNAVRKCRFTSSNYGSIDETQAAVRGNLLNSKMGGPSSRMAQIVSRQMRNYFSDTIGLKTVPTTPVSDAAARLKNGSCETMTLPLEAARCCANSVAFVMGW